MSERLNLVETLAWIAFRDKRFQTSDPHKLRRDMQRYRKRVVEPNPAKDFLEKVQSGQLPTRGGNVLSGFRTIQPGAWSALTEAEVWALADREWKEKDAVTEVKFEPKLRCKFIADDGREFTDLVAFGEWLQTMPKEVIRPIFESSTLDAELCRNFWQYIGRTDTVPRQLTVYVLDNCEALK